MEWEAGRQTGRRACSLPGVAHHLLDQLEEVAPFQGSKLRIIHQKRILEEQYFCSARRGLVARWRKELMSRAWDEKGKVDLPLWFSSFVKIQFGFSA